MVDRPAAWSHRQFQHATKQGTATVAGKPGDERHPKTAGSILKQSRFGELRDPSRYVVIIRRTSAGYSVGVPDLPGCIAAGASVEHARRMIAEAIEMHLELMDRSGDPSPTPSTSYEFAVDDDSPEALCTWVEVESPQYAMS